MQLNILDLIADDFNLNWLPLAIITCGKPIGLYHAAKLLTQTQKKKF